MATAMVRTRRPSLRAAQERYAHYYLALAERAEPHLTGPEQDAWLERLELELPHMRAVLRWAREGGEQQTGLRLAGAVSRFWQVRGYLSEGRSWLEALLVPEGEQDASCEAAVRAKALNGAGVLAYRQGDFARATALHETSLALYQESGDKGGISASLSNLGIVAWAQCDYARATVLHEEALALRRELGSMGGIATSLNNLGLVAQELGDYTRAQVLYEESYALRRELGDKEGIAISLDNLGNVAWAQGNHTRAAKLHEEGLTLQRELGNTRGIATSLNNLGEVAYGQGDYTRATTLYEESLAFFSELGEKGGSAYALLNLGNVAQTRSDYARATAAYQESLSLLQGLSDTRAIAYGLEGLATAASVPTGERETLARAARLFGAAAALRAAIGAPLPPNERAAFDRAVAALHTALGEAAFDAAWAEGQALTLEQSIALAQGEPSPA